MKGLRVHLCDTTLRDGEQAPGVVFDTVAKVALAKGLDEAGVFEIEAGTPACGEGERAAIRAVAAQGLRATVTAWCRLREEDMEAAVSCGVTQATLAVPASSLHRRVKLGIGEDDLLDRLAACLAHARGLGLGVRVALEDAGRAERVFLARLARVAQAGGALRLRLSDTVGSLEPFATAALVGWMRRESRLPLEFHAHDDFGLATANALAAARAGARFLSVTALGLGERAGNSALEEVALALERLCGAQTGIRPEALPRLCAEVARLSNRPIPEGKAVVGGAAFSHESGIHVRGVLAAPETYEPYPPELLGRTRAFVLGKHSGAAGVARQLEALGLKDRKAEAARLLPFVKRLSEAKGGPVDPKELEALALLESARKGGLR